METGKKERVRQALNKSSKDHYDRMKSAGFKKYPIWLKEDTMKKIDIIVAAKGAVKYQLIDDILNQYADNWQGE